MTLSVDQMLTKPEASIHGLDLQPKRWPPGKLPGSVTLNVNL